MKEATDWLKWISRKHSRQVSPFRFRALNLVDKAVVHFLLIMLNYVKNALLNNRQLSTQSTFKENCRNTKKINFQFHHRKFSQQRHSILSYYSRRVTRGGRGGLLPCTFLKTERKCPDFGKRWKGALILAIYVLNFSKCFTAQPCSLCPRSNLKENYESTESINFNYHLY